MKNINADIIKPIIKTIDRVIFGLEDPDFEKKNKKTPIRLQEWVHEEDQEDKIVIKSVN